jgi:hypothetical protein
MSERRVMSNCVRKKDLLGHFPVDTIDLSWSVPARVLQIAAIVPDFYFLNTRFLHQTTLHKLVCIMSEKKIEKFIIAE